MKSCSVLQGFDDGVMCLLLRVFKCQPFHFYVATVRKLFIDVCLCQTVTEQDDSILANPSS